MKRKIGNKTFDFTNNTYLMGILNVTPDSFSDGGQHFDFDNAIKHAKETQKSGADILDIGGESTRPGSKQVSIEEEKERVIPIIERIVNEVDIPISIDTSKPEVAKEGLDAGAVMVNDVTGLRNKEMLKLVAKRDVPTVIMHMRGEPRNMQENPTYKDVVKDISGYLESQAKEAVETGLNKENVYIDFGIGFGKTIEHNLELIRRMKEFESLGYPIVYGPSRKSFIGDVLDLPVDERLEGTAVAVALGVTKGASIIRVHDVKEMKRVVDLTKRIVGQ